MYAIYQQVTHAITNFTCKEKDRKQPRVAKDYNFRSDTDLSTPAPISCVLSCKLENSVVKESTILWDCLCKLVNSLAKEFAISENSVVKEFEISCVFWFKVENSMESESASKTWWAWTPCSCFWTSSVAELRPVDAIPVVSNSNNDVKSPFKI